MIQIDTQKSTQTKKLFFSCFCMLGLRSEAKNQWIKEAKYDELEIYVTPIFVDAAKR